MQRLAAIAAARRNAVEAAVQPEVDAAVRNRRSPEIGVRLELRRVGERDCEVRGPEADPRVPGDMAARRGGRPDAEDVDAVAMRRAANDRRRGALVSLRGG